MTTITLSPRRAWSLARAELTLLARNRLTLFNAVGLPLGSVLLLLPQANAGALTGEGAAVAVTIMIGALLLFVVYYNLLSAFVTRRDELVLKRLRSGECSDATILAGVAAPAVALALVQILILIAAGMALLDLPMPRNPLLLVVAVFGGALVFTALALLTAPMTRTAEAAQLTSMPVMMVSIAGAAIANLTANMPVLLTTAAELTPLAPVAVLTSHAWLGGDAGAGELAQAGAVMVCWIVAGAVAASRWFRWEPRG